MDKLIKIFVVECSYGIVRITSVDAVEKNKTYQVDLSTQFHYLGWQYIPKRQRKENNVFTNATDATQYALEQLERWIETEQEKINVSKNQLLELQQMLKKNEQGT